jgi:hypothetical protein
VPPKNSSGHHGFFLSRLAKKRPSSHRAGFEVFSQREKSQFRAMIAKLTGIIVNCSMGAQGFAGTV